MNVPVRAHRRVKPPPATIQQKRARKRAGAIRALAELEALAWAEYQDLAKEPGSEEARGLAGPLSNFAKFVRGELEAIHEDILAHARGKGLV